MGEIRGFTGEYSELNNSSAVMLEYGGVHSFSVDNLYQAMKTNDMEMRKVIALMLSDDEAYMVGQRVVLRPDWETVKESIMLDLLRLKFAEGGLKRLLLSTGDNDLINEVEYPDTFWGVYKLNGKGDNALGKLLALVRCELRERSKDEADE